MIGKPYARHLEGASTGGWQTLALQLQHPDGFGGAWVLNPDPIDFRRRQRTDIYADTNAFAVPTGPFSATERPSRRTVEGQVQRTARDPSRFEYDLREYAQRNWPTLGPKLAGKLAMALRGHPHVVAPRHASMRSASARAHSV